MAQNTLNATANGSDGGYSYHVGKTPQGQYSAVSTAGAVRFCFRADNKEEVLAKAQRAITLDREYRAEEQKTREGIARKWGTANRSLSDLKSWGERQELEEIELVRG